MINFIGERAKDMARKGKVFRMSAEEYRWWLNNTPWPDIGDATVDRMILLETRIKKLESKS